MADISKITLPSGSTYNLKDEYARTQIAALAGLNTIKFIGVSSQELTDGGTEKPIINNVEITPSVGDLFFYETNEFIWGSDNKWHALGSLETLGTLAYKNTATATYTPTGDISAPTISIKTAGASTSVNSIENIGTLPNWNCTVSNETLTLNWDAGTLPTKGESVTVKTTDATYQATAPIFSGSQATIAVS